MCHIFCSQRSRHFTIHILTRALRHGSKDKLHIKTQLSPRAWKCLESDRRTRQIALYLNPCIRVVAVPRLEGRQYHRACTQRPCTISRVLANSDQLFDIMSVSSSVSCLLVWAFVCLAYIRYWFWFRQHKDHIRATYPEHDRLGLQSQARTLLAPLQPLQAFIGVVGCTVIVFVLTTAVWWSKPASFPKIASVFGAVSRIYTLQY